MTTPGPHEEEELVRLDAIVDEVRRAPGVSLRLVARAPRSRNASSIVTVCGGSYNPFHLGHRELLRSVIEAVDGAETVAYVTLTHSLGKPLTGASYAERLYMLCLEQERLPFLNVGLVNDGYFRAFLSRLGDFYPGERRTFVGVMGADLFPRIMDERHASEFPLIFSIDWFVAERAGNTWVQTPIPEAAEPYRHRIKGLALPQRAHDVSSSGLWPLLNARDPHALAYVAPDVLDFIARRGIVF